MEDSLVARRSKRSTAGNRMEAALAEFKAEDLGVDVEEDADFAIDKGTCLSFDISSMAHFVYPDRGGRHL